MFIRYYETKHLGTDSLRLMATYSPDMRLFNAEGGRLYVSADERARFLIAAAEESREHRVFCHLLHYTGCRPSEGLELTPQRILLDENTIVFHTLKKRKVDNQGRPKKPQYRHIPVPERLIEQLDLLFDLRRMLKSKQSQNTPLWPMSRPTAWRMVKRVMARADIKGPQATAKGLRHGFGIAMLAGEKPLPLNVLRDLLGHSDTQTTEIYLQAIGYEKRQLVMQAWE